MLEKLEQFRHEAFVAKVIERGRTFNFGQTRTVSLREMKKKGVDRVLAELDVSD
jgi:hypothetical protein